MKYLISNDLSSAYQMNGNSLEFSPLLQDGTFDTDDFGPVEPEMVGEEIVLFEGLDLTLYEVFGIVTKRLTQ